VWLALGALLRGLLIWFPRSKDDDTDAYLELGRNLLHHGTYGFMGDDGVVSPALFRLPGYPIFLAALGGNTTLVCVVQSLIELAGCLMLGLFLRRHVSERAGLAAIALSATCFFTADYAATPLTESLSLFATMAAIHTLGEFLAKSTGNPKKPAILSEVRRFWRTQSKDPGAARPTTTIQTFSTSTSTATNLLPVAASASLAMMLRPDGAILAISLAIALFFHTKRFVPALRTVILFGLLAAVPLVPWAIRNAVTFHVFQPLAPRHVNDPGERVNLGFYRWLRTWSVDFETTGLVFWKVGTESISLKDFPPRAFDSEAQRDQTAELIAAYNIKKDVDQPLDDRFAALAAERIHTHPLRYYVWVPALRIADMWLRPRTEGLDIALSWWRWRDHPGESAAAIALALLNLLYIVGAIAGAFRRPPLAVFLATYLMLRCILLGTMENSEPRYTLEAYPIILVLSAMCWASRHRTSALIT
jgi:hypothetical protein